MDKTHRNYVNTLIHKALLAWLALFRPFLGVVKRAALRQLYQTVSRVCKVFVCFGYNYYQADIPAQLRSRVGLE